MREQSTALLECAAQLRSVAHELHEEIERGARIPELLVERLLAAGLYRMVVPRQLGGLELDLLTLLRAAELLAEGDGSVGWNVVNNAIGQLIALSLPDAGVQEIFDRGPDTIIAGTAVTGGGTGVSVDGGYVVSGHWRFGSGCREAHWMMANFDVPVAAGVELRRVFFPAAQSTIVETWDMTGMRGTGSHDWTVADVFVPVHRTVVVPSRALENQWHRWPGPLYALPVHALVGPHHSMIATGIARAGIDALAELAGAKVPRGRQGLLRDQPQVQESIARAEALLEAGRAYRAAALGDIWATIAANEPSTLAQRARCRLAASYAVDSARQAMDLVYRAGGTTSSQRTHQLARCWRDLHVVAQAASIAPEWYPLVGRTLLGIDASPRLT
jgi:indole-3-acetate monooxygenase